MMQHKKPLKLVAETTGRALFIAPNHALYIARGYDIYRSDDGGISWMHDCSIPIQGWRSAAINITAAARLLRLNVQALQVFEDGTRVAIARNGIYRAPPGESVMRRTWMVERGQRPISLARVGDTVVFGEYGALDGCSVRVYASTDRGATFNVVFEFERDDIYHIHNVVPDPFAGHFWLLAGDHGNTCGIGALSADFRTFTWIARGTQMARAVNVLPRPTELIYGTDSELEANYIVRIDKKTGRIIKMLEIPGSSLYAADFGRHALISTCVEPSKVNKSTTCRLFCSSDDLTWSEILEWPKDWMPERLFQFGTIVIPCVENLRPRWGMVSSQGLADRHNRVVIFEIDASIDGNHNICAE